MTFALRMATSILGLGFEAQWERKTGLRIFMRTAVSSHSGGCELVRSGPRRGHLMKRKFIYANARTHAFQPSSVDLVTIVAELGSEPGRISRVQRTVRDRRELLSLRITGSRQFVEMGRSGTPFRRLNVGYHFIPTARLQVAPRERPVSPGKSLILRSRKA